MLWFRMIDLASAMLHWRCIATALLGVLDKGTSSREEDHKKA